MGSNGLKRNYSLFVGDSENVIHTKLVKNVDIIITSPPYWNAIDYKKHSSENGDWRERYVENYQNDYLPKMHRILKVCYDKLNPGGIICINSGTVLVEGQQIPLPSDLARICLELGFKPLKRITWNKITGGVKRAGSVIKYPYPGYWHPNIMTEQIHVFVKSGAKHYVNKAAAELYGDVWNVTPVPPGLLRHPAPFPVEIPFMLLDIYAKHDAYVLDPFLGSGSTLVAACLKGLNGAGIDLDKKYVITAKERIENCQPFIRKNSIEINLMSKRFWLVNVNWKSRGRTRQGSGK